MKRSHLANLQTKIPNLISKKMADIGSGNGKFMREVKEAGGQIVGLEYNPERAAASGSIHGSAEHCPWPDQSFEFINMAEVIEHVQDPVQVLREVRRLLTPHGVCYISVPSRFSIFDPHYHLYFINWLPRFMADSIASLFRPEKGEQNGRQKLSEMNYYTYRDFVKTCREVGLEVTDSRPIPNWMKLPYDLLKWNLQAFHFFVRPSSIKTIEGF